MQYNLIRIVSKVNPVKDYIPLNFNIIHTSICLMSVFPRPPSGSFRTLCQLPVHFFCIDQSHIPLILFYFFIHQAEDSVRTGHSHDDRIQLHTDLIDRHTEALIKGQKACQAAECEPSDVVQRKYSSCNCTHNIADISDLCIDRSQNIGISIRSVRTDI